MTRASRQSSGVAAVVFADCSDFETARNRQVKRFKANTQVSPVDPPFGSELIGDPECVSNRNGEPEMRVALAMSDRGICLRVSTVKNQERTKTSMPGDYPGFPCPELGVARPLRMRPSHSPRRLTTGLHCRRDRAGPESESSRQVVDHPVRALDRVQRRGHD